MQVICKKEGMEGDEEGEEMHIKLRNSSSEQYPVGTDSNANRK